MASHILLYHGVTSSKSFGIENYSKKHINIKLFEKQMKFLKKYRTVVPLRKIRQIKNLTSNNTSQLMQIFCNNESLIELENTTDSLQDFAEQLVSVNNDTQFLDDVPFDIINEEFDKDNFIIFFCIISTYNLR